MNTLLNLPTGPSRLNAVAEAWGLVWSGDRRARVDLTEAMSTSDFQVATGDVLHRELLARYADTAPVWSQLARRTTVPDFKPKSYIDLLGGKASLDLVPELSPYPARVTERSKVDLSVKKFGARMSISWEALVNDDLQEVRTWPQLLAQSARDTEDKIVTGLIASSTGPNTAMFKSANGNAPATAALSADSLTAALTAVSSKTDADGRPVFLSGFNLVVPPALAPTARRILTATEIRTTVDSVTTIEANYLAGQVNLIVNPWLPVIDTSANAARTWYLLPAPNAPRPSLVAAFLAGHESPELRVKSDTGNAVSGGPLAAEQGSFDIDDVQYRVRHVLGAAALDPAGTYASAPTS